MIPIGTMDFKGLVAAIISNILQPLTGLILALAVVYFLWNIAQVIRKGDQPDELAKFKGKAIWGVVAIAVMVSLWGLVRILVNTFVPGTTSVPLFNQGGGNSLFQIDIGGGGVQSGGTPPDAQNAQWNVLNTGSTGNTQPTTGTAPVPAR